MTKCDKPWSVLQRPLFLTTLYRTTWQLSRCWKPEVIHAHWIISQGLAARFSCGNTVPIFCATHGGNLHSLGAFAFHHIKSLAIRRCNSAAVVSDSLVDKVHPLALGIRVEFTPMAKDFSAHYTPPPDPDCQLLFVDRLAGKKGLRYLLDVFAQVFHDCPVLKLTIVRNGPLHNEFRRQVASLGVNRCVQFLVSLPHAETRDGDQEVFGLVVFEAMGLSCPVIASDLPAARQGIEPSITEIMVQPVHPVALADPIRQCLGDSSQSQTWPLRRCMQYNSALTGVSQHSAIPACSTN